MLTYPNPIQDLLEEAARQSKQYAARLMKQLARESVERVQTHFRKKVDGLLQIDSKVDLLLEKMAKECKEAMRGPNIRIEVPKQKLMHTRMTPILGKAIFKEPLTLFSMEVSCIVACGHWHKLGKIEGDVINIMDHLDKLIPVRKNQSYRQGPIGLITFQNGMMNNLKDFEEIGSLIVNQFPEGPLVIGLHNPTTSILPLDMIRFMNEPKENKRAVYSLAQLVKTLTDTLPRLNPNLLWTHFAHSEAGLIANAVLQICNSSTLYETTRKYLKNNLITATYGAVKPIPNDYVLSAYNTYSKNDIALFFGKDYIDQDINKITDNPHESRKKYKGKTYEIQVVDSLTTNAPVVTVPKVRQLSFDERMQMSFLEMIAYQEELRNHSYIAEACAIKVNRIAFEIKDHGFKEKTYQKAFEKNVDDMREKHKIYNAKFE